MFVEIKLPLVTPRQTWERSSLFPPPEKTTGSERYFTRPRFGTAICERPGAHAYV
jgi:hypothetical protein